MHHQDVCSIVAAVAGLACLALGVSFTITLSFVPGAAETLPPQIGWVLIAVLALFTFVLLVWIVRCLVLEMTPTLAAPVMDSVETRAA
jgi:hypothetical protein